MGRAREVVTKHGNFLQALLDRLGAHEILRCEDLADEFGVSQRTIYRAISSLREMGNRIDGSTGRSGGVMLRKPLPGKITDADAKRAVGSYLEKQL